MNYPQIMLLIGLCCGIYKLEQQRDRAEATYSLIAKSIESEIDWLLGLAYNDLEYLTRSGKIRKDDAFTHDARLLLDQMKDTIEKAPSIHYLERLQALVHRMHPLTQEYGLHPDNFEEHLLLQKLPHETMKDRVSLCFDAIKVDTTATCTFTVNGEVYSRDQPTLQLPGKIDKYEISAEVRDSRNHIHKVKHTPR